LKHLLDLAVQNNPEGAAAQARVEAARGKLIQAGLCPNPVVALSLDEFGGRHNAAGFLGTTISQEIVTAGKLRLAQAAAAQGVAAADWQAVTRWWSVATRVRLAYYECLTAQREVLTAEEAVKVAQVGLDAALKLQQAGSGTEPDVLRARVEVYQSHIRLDTARQRLEAAGKLLAAAVGVPTLASCPCGDDLEAIPPVYDWPTLTNTVLVHSSEVQETLALILQAEQQLRLARAQRYPNLMLALRPMYVFPEQTAEGYVQIGAPLPIFNRNQGNILSAEADLARTRAEARLTELRLLERLTVFYQRYQTARRQTEQYQKEILPAARESLRLVRLGYERGDPKYDYTTLLDAQRTIVAARLAQVQALGELWRAVAEIEGLLQCDVQVSGGGAPRSCAHCPRLLFSIWEREQAEPGHIEHSEERRQAINSEEGEKTPRWQANAVIGLGGVR
jgi:cobalt-zinc-cadmium efflux system outer membrane protein